MTKFSNKSIFSPFSPFLGQFSPPKNLALSRTSPHGPLTPCRVSEKTNEPIPRKVPDGRAEGQKDRHPNS